MDEPGDQHGDALRSLLPDGRPHPHAHVKPPRQVHEEVINMVRSGSMAGEGSCQGRQEPDTEDEGHAKGQVEGQGGPRAEPDGATVRAT